MHVECTNIFFLLFLLNCSHSTGYAEEERGGCPPLHQLPQATQGVEGAPHTLCVRQILFLTTGVYTVLCHFCGEIFVDRRLEYNEEIAVSGSMNSSVL